MEMRFYLTRQMCLIFHKTCERGNCCISKRLRTILARRGDSRIDILIHDAGWGKVLVPSPVIAVDCQRKEAKQASRTARNWNQNTKKKLLSVSPLI
jgi:hypothetical protein